VFERRNGGSSCLFWRLLGPFGGGVGDVEDLEAVRTTTSAVPASRHGLEAILPSFQGYKSHAAGAVLETPGEYLLLLSWESMDAYKAATQGDDAKAAMAKVKAAAQEVKVSHVSIVATIAGN